MKQSIKISSLKWGFLFSALSVVSGVAFANQSFKINAGDKSVNQGRCYMDSCSWSKTLAVSIIQNTSEQAILDVSLLGGEAKNKRGKTKQIVWNHKPHRVSITCSYKHPSIGLDGQLDDLPLGPNGVPGVLEDSASLYFHYCHSYDGGLDAGIRKFGYNIVDAE